jgi:Short C-terminal domain
MLRRRAMVGRGGPGIVGTMATAAVAGAAAGAAARGVDRRMARRDARHQQEDYAQQAAIDNQAQLEEMQAQMAQMQAQQAYAAQQAPPPPAPAPAGGGDDLMAKLQQLTQLKQAGALTDEEFAAAKAKLLA